MERYNPFRKRTELAKEHKTLNVFDLRLPEGTKEKAPELKASILVNEHLDSFTYSEAAVDNLIAAIKLGYVMVELKEDGNLNILLMEVQQLPKELGHVTETATFHKNIDQPVWGKADPDQFTYLQTTDFGVEGYFANDFSVALEGKPKPFARVYVDSEKLKQTRGVFIDPESLNATEEEFGHSFIVVGGIPRQAIIRAEIIEVPVRPIKDFGLKDGDFELPPEETEQDIEKRQKRLIEFLKDKKI